MCICVCERERERVQRHGPLSLNEWKEKELTARNPSTMTDGLQVKLRVGYLVKDRWIGRMSGRFLLGCRWLMIHTSYLPTLSTLNPARSVRRE